MGKHNHRHLGNFDDLQSAHGMECLDIGEMVIFHENVRVNHQKGSKTLTNYGKIIIDVTFRSMVIPANMLNSIIVYDRKLILPHFTIYEESYRESKYLGYLHHVPKKLYIFNVFPIFEKLNKNHE